MNPGPNYKEGWSISEIAVGGSFDVPLEWPSPVVVGITTDRKQLMYWDDEEGVVEPYYFDAPEGEEWDAVSVGYVYTCALTTAGTLDDRLGCWDDDEVPTPP